MFFLSLSLSLSLSPVSSWRQRQINSPKDGGYLTSDVGRCQKYKKLLQLKEFGEHMRYATVASTFKWERDSQCAATTRRAARHAWAVNYCTAGSSVAGLDSVPFVITFFFRGSKKQGHEYDCTHGTLFFYIAEKATYDQSFLRNVANRINVALSVWYIYKYLVWKRRYCSTSCVIKTLLCKVQNCVHLETCASLCKKFLPRKHLLFHASVWLCVKQDSESFKTGCTRI